MSTALQPTREGDVILAQDAPFRLEAGGSLQPVTIRYAVYGELNETRDNAVLICHALSGSARAADWWPEMFGSVFDPSRDCVICTNILGSCYGSTGPASVNPATGQPYGPDFPLVTVRDMVRAQAEVLDQLGVQRLRIVIGASIGGMQALQWAVDYPDRVEHCIAIGTAPLSAMGLALNHLQRQAIRLDPKFNGGKYSPHEQPGGGLGLARAIAMCSYKSAELFDERYARKHNRNGEDPRRSVRAPLRCSRLSRLSRRKIRTALRRECLPGDFEGNGHLRSGAWLCLGSGGAEADSGAHFAGRHHVRLAISAGRCSRAGRAHRGSRCTLRLHRI